jgi:cytochrome c biogenesis protein CcdA
VVGLCLLVASVQVGRIARLLVTWGRRQEPVLAFGQADVVYFYEPTCLACQIASPAILELRRYYPRYRIARVDSSTPRGLALQEEYNLAYRVPLHDRDRVPAAFAGRRSFIGAAAILTDLPAYLRNTSLVRPSRRLRPDERGHATLAQRLRSLGALPVLVAALVDSVNPCAIATLVFFLSYLTWAGCRPRDLVWIGGLFTLGVFVTYTLIGLGLLQALRSLSGISVLARALYPAAALVTLVLAAVSFLDYRRTRHGETGRVALQLPRGLRRQIHWAIRGRFAPARSLTTGRNRAGAGACPYEPPGGRGRPPRLPSARLALTALSTAVLVSGLEFTCTSQVYLPTLIYMARSGDQRLRATSLLLLYNLVFVLPLILLSVAAALGTSTRSLAKLAVRHAAAARLAMSLLFIGFSIYLVKVTVQLFVPG